MAAIPSLAPRPLISPTKETNNNSLQHSKKAPAKSTPAPRFGRQIAARRNGKENGENDLNKNDNSTMPVIIDDDRMSQQDTNDRSMADMQRGGTYPARIAGELLPA
jgi:hypothetical protein